MAEYAENRLGAALNHSPVVLGHKSLAEPPLHAEDAALFFYIFFFMTILCRTAEKPERGR